MLDLSFFRNRTFAAAATVAGLVSFGMFGVFFFLTLFLQNVQGYSAFQMGLRSLPMTGAIIFTAPIAGNLAGRIGPRIPMTVGLAIVGVGMLLMERITPGMPYSALWWNLLMMGIGMGLVMTPMTAAVMNAVPRQASRHGLGHLERQPRGRRRLRHRPARRDRDATSSPATCAARWRSCRSRPGSRARSSPWPARAAARPREACRPGSTPRRCTHIVDNAFVSGMHVAFWVSAGILLTGAVIAAVFVHKGVPDMVSEARTPAESRSRRRRRLGHERRRHRRRTSRPPQARRPATDDPPGAGGASVARARSGTT